jgi:hypothetical protein
MNMKDSTKQTSMVMVYKILSGGGYWFKYTGNDKFANISSHLKVR